MRAKGSVVHSEGWDKGGVVRVGSRAVYTLRVSKGDSCGWGLGVGRCKHWVRVGVAGLFLKHINGPSNSDNLT